MAVIRKTPCGPATPGDVSRPGRGRGTWRGRLVAARWFGAVRRLRAATGAGPGDDAGGAPGEAAVSAPSGDGRASSPSQAASPATGAASGPRILIVDDEPSIRRVCSFALRGGGWRPETEASSIAALYRVLNGERFDALVLDYAMPELDGLEFLRRLQALPPEARPAVLLVSAHADGAAAWTALRLGVWDFLPKPLTPDELRRRVRRLLERPAAAARGEAHPLALRLAAVGEWARARAALAHGAAESDELVRGLLFEIEGDAAAAADCFSRARWWPNWNHQGPEIWAELSRRLDAAA